MKNKVKSVLKKVSLFSEDALLVISKKLMHRSILEESSISAKFNPYLPEQPSWIIPKISNDYHQNGNSKFPLPPKEIRGGYLNDTSYISGGQQHVEKMKSITEASGFHFEAGEKILDFGCSAGRMLVWFTDLSEKCEIWGTDVREASIVWCQQYLSPPFRFFTTTSFPHLPFEDNYFGFIYAGSVFTHIPNMADTWLLELKRVLRPGGRIYITVHDKHSIEILHSEPHKNQGLYNMLFSSYQTSQFMSSNFGMLTISSGQYHKGFDAQVFYDIDFLCHKWGRILNVLSIDLEAYAYQTAILLSKN